jgi:transcriptional regulator GlxA family with amidase domain
MIIRRIVLGIKKWGIVKMKKVNILLFDDFTTLDALGPAEVLGRLKDHYEVSFISMTGGLISGSAGVKIDTKKITEVKQKDILLIPGGFGTRKLVTDSSFLNTLKLLAEESEMVLCVCTGSALLAKTGLLNNKMATSNKLSWEWVISQNQEVNWVKKARWIVDGKYYTSSGITAGIDMALGFIADKHGNEVAESISKALEYIWNKDREIDPFA